MISYPNIAIEGILHCLDTSVNKTKTPELSLFITFIYIFLLTSGISHGDHLYIDAGMILFYLNFDFGIDITTTQFFNRTRPVKSHSKI